MRVCYNEPVVSEHWRLQRNDAYTKHDFWRNQIMGFGLEPSNTTSGIKSPIMDGIALVTRLN